MIKLLRENLTTWLIPLVGLYIYCFVVLAQYGYFSYFKLPTSIFVEASPRLNIIFMFAIVKAIFTIFHIISWWIILGLIISISIIFIFVNTRVLQSVACVGLIMLLYFSPNLGNALAQSKTNFDYIDGGCLSILNTAPQSKKYVILAYFNDLISLNPIDENNKILPQYYVKKITDISCEIKSGQFQQFKI